MAHKMYPLVKRTNVIPIIAHNSSKYDVHLFIKELSEIDDQT